MAILYRGYEIIEDEESSDYGLSKYFVYLDADGTGADFADFDSIPQAQDFIDHLIEAR